MAEAKLKTNLVYEKDPSIVCRQIDDETLLVPIKQNVGDLESIFTLNEVGARVWELIDGKKSVVDITKVVSSEYDAPDEEIEKDIADFILQLKEASAIKSK